MIKKGVIVVPTDFSKQSTEALRRAAKLAQQFNGKVHLLHVIEPPLFIDADLILMTPIDAVVEAQHAAAEKRLQKLKDESGLAVEVHLLDALHSTAQTICDYAKEHGADLIVIGRHGEKGELEHMLLGSTAERVIRFAPCSVLVTMPHGIFAE